VPPSLKVRAAAAVEGVLAEEAVLMAEALADVALVTTIATADVTAQQTTINNRLGANPCLVVATTEVSTWRCHFHRIFLHEFLWDRKSCICTGFLRIPLDSCSRQKLSDLDQQLKKALC
jgi:hypothetical protein